MSKVWVSHVGTALPGPAIAQETFAQWMRPRLHPAANVDRFERFVQNAGVAYRHSIFDLDSDVAAQLYPLSGAVAATSVRSQLFQQHAPILAQQAAENAQLSNPESITHIITVSCTGGYAPGLDAHLIQTLQLSPTCKRLHLGFLGCYAAVPALRNAWEICRADPSHRVLVVCCELSSLHLHHGPDDDQLLAACLFADGASAVLVESSDQSCGLGVRICGHESRLIADSKNDMTWTIGDHGFDLRLSPYVSRSLAVDLQPLIAALLDQLPMAPPMPSLQWMVHPGGPRILETVQARLNLPEDALQLSHQALAQAGNRSSATILSILQAACATPAWQGHGILLAFGPGLTAEALLLERS